MGVSALTSYRRSAQQVSCKIDDEVAILHLDRALYFGLQGAGVELWEALEQPKSIEELRNAIVARFAVGPHDCEADIRAILANLQNEGLVEIVE